MTFTVTFLDQLNRKCRINGYRHSSFVCFTSIDNDVRHCSCRYSLINQKLNDNKQQIKEKFMFVYFMNQQ